MISMFSYFFKYHLDRLLSCWGKACNINVFLFGEISSRRLSRQISSYLQVEPLVQSEKLVERAYVRPYTPYVYPRPQVVTIIILMILIIVVLLYFNT